MKKTSYLVGLVSVAALMLPLSLIAQDEDADAEAPAPLSDVWIVVVKPGMETQFNEAMATHLQFRKDAGASNTWQAYRVAVGHNITPIQFRSCCFTWADLDDNRAEDEEKGLNENFGATVAQYVEHYHHYLEETDWENSHWPETGTSGPYYGVTSWKNKQGRGPASDNAKEKLSQLGITGGWASDDNNWLWMSRIGGDSVTAIVSSYANYAEMEDDDPTFFEFVTEELGAEEAGATFGAFSNGFEDSDYTIWVLDESISTPEDEEDDEE
jgi:hypothetical protein